MLYRLKTYSNSPVLDVYCDETRVLGTGQMRKEGKSLVGKSEEKRPLGTHRSKWEGNIMEARGFGSQ
jgi:hypothetical protein